jgi:hypothetical protein
MSHLGRISLESNPNQPPVVNEWHKQAFNYDDLRHLVETQFHPSKSEWYTQNQWGITGELSREFLFGIFWR